MTLPARLPSRLAAVAGFALLIALCARLTVPMVPVPMTMQTWAVLLAGVALGPRRGGAAVLLYLALALVGLPVLSDGASGSGPFTGPTAGYLIAFPLAAGLAGVLAEGGRLRRFIPAVAWLFCQGEVGMGFFLLFWGFFVISGVDNILKPYLISRGGNLPLIVVLLGVFGGVLAFGFMGLFLGPTLLAVAYSLLEDWLVKEVPGVVTPAKLPGNQSNDAAVRD